MAKKKSTPRPPPISAEKHKKKQLFRTAKKIGAPDVTAALCADGVISLAEVRKILGR